MKIKYEKKIESTSLKTNTLTATILESGNIKDIDKGIIRINSLTNNNLENGLINLYLRVEKNKEINFTRLMGINSPSSFKVVDNKCYYEGSYLGCQYEVCFCIVEDTGFFKINLDVPEDVRAQVFYGMDVAISDLYAVRNNEAYVCQYLNHSVSQDENGYTIMTRQNSGINHYLETGSLTKNVGYSTDGYDFFGNNYKLTNLPEALVKGELSKRIYQYEFAYLSLVSPIIENEKQTVIFYFSYLDDHYEVTKEPLLKEAVLKLYKTIDFKNPETFNKPLKLKIDYNNVLAYEPLNMDQINELFNNRKQEEFYDDELMSFFTDNYSYVCVGKKEAYQERSTGQILLSTKVNNFEETLATTVFSFGVFSSQVVAGNAGFNKLDANLRNALDVLKIKGQRIFIKLNNEYKLLGVPSLFEVGLNYAKWYYKLDDDLVVIETCLDNLKPILILKITSEKAYDFILTDFLTLGQNEYENTYEIEVNQKEINYYFSNDSFTHNHYENLTFKKSFNQDFKYLNDEVFYEDLKSRNESLEVIEVHTNALEMVLLGNTFGKNYDLSHDDLPVIKKRYLSFIDDLLGNLNLRIDNEYKNDIDAFNILARWYTENMLVHFTSPHGLEQYSGAAWGTRDVSQGPFEFMMAFNHFDYAKEIILKVFSHQYEEDGDWPQWFMFDRYQNIQDLHSHGDIILWPLRMVSMYLERTNDYEILKEKVPYTRREGVQLTSESYPILGHILLATTSIENNFIHDTHLSKYGGGDWDDTLQPANQELALNLVSSWSVSLTYEVFTKLSKVLESYDLSLSKKYSLLAMQINEDYHKYLIKDLVPAGFLDFTNQELNYIIHPSDKKTNIQYRLLPINRGIVSEIFTEEEKDQALKIIKEQLLFPDGVRLMNKTIPYKGGINTTFKRAETASNFGREIGLQYCHAHIRYCEALAKAGVSEELYHNLKIINPILINETLKNATLRQRNCYFSSSDGDFLNRYDAMENFEKLRTQEVKVKGGWRIYSSGPGIYLYQLITNFLGIRLNCDNLVLDPVIPRKLTGLETDFKILCYNLHIKYVHATKSSIKLNNQELNLESLKQTYKTSGYEISLSLLKEDNEIEISLGDCDG